MKGKNQRIIIELDIEKVVEDTMARTLEEKLPDIIRKATRKEWITTTEVMEILSCTRPHCQFLRKAQKLPYTQNGRKILYHIDDVENYLNRGKVKGKS